MAFANHPAASYLLLAADGLYYPPPPVEEVGGVSVEELLGEIE